MLTDTPISQPDRVNIDEPSNEASDMSFRVRSLYRDNKTWMIHARPMISCDFWVLRLLFPDWLSLEIDDLLKAYGKDAELTIIWLGTRYYTQKNVFQRPVG